MAHSKEIALENRDRYIDIGLNIAYYRKREGMTQEQLAEKADLSRSYLSALEAPNMVKSMSVEVLFSIADALKIPASRLLEFRD